MLTGEQIRAARALLRWEQRQLASEAKISVETVKRLEKFSGSVSGNIRTVDAIIAAFERANVEFTADKNGSLGVFRRGPLTRF